MKLDDLNWYAAGLFLDVCSAGGITAAVRSGTAGISQPALSAQMLALEESLGRTLFERKPFRLTAEGRLARAEFEALRRRMDESLATIRGQHTGLLRIAASDVVINHHLPQLLKELRMPSTARLTLRDAPSHALPALVREGEVDLAFGILPPQAPQGRNPMVEVLLELPLGVIHPQPPSAQSTATTWAALKTRLRAGEPPGLVGLPANNLVSSHLARSLERHHLAWPISLEVSSLNHVPTYVALGMGYGVALGPAAAHLRAKPFAWIPFPQAVVAPVRIGVWHGAHLPPLALRLLAIARKYARSINP